MPESALSTFRSGVRERAGVSTATLLGQVMFLVAVAIGFMAAGTIIGRDLSRGTALACSLAGFAMLLIQSFVPIRALRTGTFAVVWLYSLALLLGLGLGPAIDFIVANDPTVLTQAIGGTALTVLGMASLGFALSKDLARWMRPLSLLVFGAVIVSIVLTLFVSGGNPIVSLVIYGLSALLIMVDFNYLRKHGTEDQAVLLATGIFVSIVNIFVSLLNLLGSD